MAIAVNIAFLIDLHTGSCNYLCGDRQYFTRQNDAIKLELQPSLAHKVAGIFVTFKMSTKHCSTRKNGVSEGANGTEMT
jgi:hypothetical protein